MMEYHAGPCDDNFLAYFKDFKRCPQCGMAIQKISGCNHMTCFCHYNFCFVCLSPWSDAHYSCADRDLRRQNQRGPVGVYQR